MAIPPQAPTGAAGLPAANPNQNTSVSAAGIAALRAGEGQRNGGGYYDNSAHNCTRGVGILVHTGPCSAEELARAPDVQGNEATFQTRLHAAEAAVRRQVTDRALTQDQFNSLTSAAFNLGATGVQPVTNQANRGDDAGVQRELRARVFVRPRDTRGRPVGPPQWNRGLFNRREREAQPFAQPGPGR